MSNQLRRNLEEIISPTVNVENIGTYEDTVSDNLISFIGVVVARFAEEDGHVDASGTDFEDAAFEKLELPSVNSVLDTIQEKIDMVRAAGQYMTNRATRIESVITPTDKKSIDVSGNGSAEFTQVDLKDRVQTALYVLQKLGFDLDKTKLSYGNVTPEMFRYASYYTFEIPEANKILHICDEENNASYIFSTKVMSEIEMTIEDINNLTKSEKNQLINAYRNRGLGYRFIYKSGWADELEQLILADETELADLAQENYENNFNKLQVSTKPSLAPRAPEGTLSIKGFAEKLGVAHRTIATIIAREDLQLDDFLFATRTVPGIPSTLQQLLIRKYPGLEVEVAPEEVVSVKKFAIIIGVARTTLDQIIADGKIQTPEYKFGPRVAPGLLLKSQKIIREVLATNPPKNAKDTISIAKFAKKHKVTPATVKTALDELGIVPAENKFHTQPALGLTSEQQRDLLRHRSFTVAEAPEDVVSLDRFVKKLHSSHGFIDELLAEIGIVPDLYKFYTAVSAGLTSGQQAQVTALFNERKPRHEGSITISRLTRQTHTSWSLVSRILKDQGITTITAVSGHTTGEAIPADKVQAVRKAIQAHKEKGSKK